MRAMLLLVLLLAVLAFVSMYDSALVPFWRDRGPAVMSHLDEGRYRDALSAAMAPDKPGTKSDRWSQSEPRGEPAPPEEPSTGAVDPPAPDTEPTPPDTTGA